MVGNGYKYILTTLYCSLSNKRCDSAYNIERNRVRRRMCGRVRVLTLRFLCSYQDLWGTYNLPLDNFGLCVTGRWKLNLER